jgi:hypothetical protein
VAAKLASSKHVSRSKTTLPQRRGNADHVSYCPADVQSRVIRGGLKRDYVGCMDRSSGAAVLAQLPDAFRHFNEVHPHSALGYKSPRMFRKERRRQALRTNGWKPA